MDTLECTKEKGNYIRYLLLCNKAPQNLVALNSKYLLSHSFSMSGIWVQISWMLYVKVSHKALIKAGVVIITAGSNGGRSASEFICCWQDSLTGCLTDGAFPRGDQPEAALSSVLCRPSFMAAHDLIEQEQVKQEAGQQDCKQSLFVTSQ